MLTPGMRRIQNSNAWFPYDRYGRHDLAVAAIDIREERDAKP